MPVELRKWFQITTAALGLGAAFACWHVVHASIPSAGPGPQMALSLLFVGAIAGFHRLITLLLPLVLVKLLPGRGL